jgi:nitronate monooxygenase
MAGGPSTPALVAAVARAGGFPFVAGGYLTADALAAGLAQVRAQIDAPLGVNLFVPSLPGDPEAVHRYARQLAAEAARLHAELGTPRWEDDAYRAKLEIVLAARVHTISFTFGCPPAEDIARVHASGARAAVTVTSAAQASDAARAGADELIVQGTEAGGHQGGSATSAPSRTPLVDLLAQVRAATGLPMIAAGGLATGADVGAALAAGASAAALGTALLCTDEAGTSDVHRDAILQRRFEHTMLTRAFSGRWARGLANAFAREHSGAAPAAYPEVHHLTAPLRAAARRANDPDVPNLWAGTGWREARAEPAAEVIDRIAHGLPD